jgi:hypothetical protein
MSKYGYVGKESDIPQQAFKSNAGVLSVNDHLALSQENKLTQYGQLELIETQTVSSAVAQVDFTSIKEDIYNVHFITYNNITCANDGKKIGIRYFENGTIESGSVYQYATYVGNAGASTFTGVKNSADDFVRISDNAGNDTGESMNGYVYCYNLGDSTKYSYSTCHSMCATQTASGSFEYGSQVLPQRSVVDGIRFIIDGGFNFSEGTISLYGMRYS